MIVTSRRRAHVIRTARSVARLAYHAGYEDGLANRLPNAGPAGDNAAVNVGGALTTDRRRAMPRHVPNP